MAEEVKLEELKTDEDKETTETSEEKVEEKDEIKPEGDKENPEASEEKLEDDEESKKEKEKPGKCIEQFNVNWINLKTSVFYYLMHQPTFLFCFSCFLLLYNPAD